MRLARDTAGDDFTIDFATGRQIGMPVLVLRAPAVRPSNPLPVLSRRERQIAALIAHGARNKDIAAKLGISLATVKDHIHNALTKTGFATRAQLAAAICTSTG
jgi:non-specific serine/threonine protein kinase